MFKNNPRGFILKKLGICRWNSCSVAATGYFAGNAGEDRSNPKFSYRFAQGAWHKVYNQVHDSLGQSIMDENKRRYSRWLDTGQEPDYVPDLSGAEVSRLVEKAWQPLNDEQVSVLENGLVALLHSLQKQPKDYVINLVFKIYPCPLNVWMKLPEMPFCSSLSL